MAKTTQTQKRSTQPKTTHSIGQRFDTSDLDREFVADSFGPPSPRNRTRWERAKRKPGRPREGRGAQVISVSIEKGLLKQSDGLARKMGISRARLVARGLRAVLAAEGL
jgi:N-acyl-D-aspartate/D-glutamate deacylase